MYKHGKKTAELTRGETLADLVEKLWEAAKAQAGFYRAVLDVPADMPKVFP